jgi:hypothetical protein
MQQQIHELIRGMDQLSLSELAGTDINGYDAGQSRIKIACVLQWLLWPSLNKVLDDCDELFVRSKLDEFPNDGVIIKPCIEFGRLQKPQDGLYLCFVHIPGERS